MGENREINALEMQMKLNKDQRVPNPEYNAQEQLIGGEDCGGRISDVSVKWVKEVMI